MGNRQEQQGVDAPSEPEVPTKRRKQERHTSGGSDGDLELPETAAHLSPTNTTAPTQEATVAADEEGAAQVPAATADAPAAARPKPGKAPPVLPWMRVPIAIDASEGTPLEEVQGLDPRLCEGLQASGIEVLFPVQTVVWHETAGGASDAHDVCICAPTGSGKTLAYALPVLQALAGRRVPRLRALAVLPTRDLAQQVFSVFVGLCPRLGLNAGLACGRASLAAEAELLAAGNTDILVATPGRLIAHLEGTPGFCLRHLRFLIVDETDRLLRQAYQGWLPKALAALHIGPAQAEEESAAGAGTAAAAAAEEVGRAGGALLESWAEQQRQQGQAEQLRRVVKFVVSATLTRDPSKIDRLGLHCPRYIATSAEDHRHKLPRSLQELKLVVPAERKPAALAALLQELAGQRSIVFTSSVEATHRLFLLLNALRTLGTLPEGVVEYSSLLRPEERAASLAAFTSSAAKVLVCSDAMTRGMDVAGVENVVNYDAPVYVKTYVHRAGRTARAGRAGRVFSLLRPEEVRHFKGMLRKADNTYVQDHRLKQGVLESVRPAVEAGLDRMQEALLAEAAASPGAAAAEAQQQVAADKQQQADGGQGGGGKQPKRHRLGGVQEFTLL